jgi:hypothetical protein
MPILMSFFITHTRGEIQPQEDTESFEKWKVYIQTKIQQSFQPLPNIQNNKT